MLILSMGTPYEKNGNHPSHHIHPWNKPTNHYTNRIANNQSSKLIFLDKC